MKKLFISLVIAFAFCTSSMAQVVYNEVRSKAIAAVNNPATNPMLKKINQFKVDALDYMGIKMKETMPDSTVNFLDRQAYALNNFVSLYMQTILDNRKQPAAYQVKLIKLFMDASYSNPLFNDPDKELVLSYFSDGNSLTRFSLDTDWRRAFVAAALEVKKIK